MSINNTPRMLHSFAALLLCVAAAFALTACGGAQNPSAAAATPVVAAATTSSTAPVATTTQATAKPNSDSTINLTRAVLTTGIDDQDQPVDETSTFKQSVEIYLSLTFEGRPKEGLIRAELMYQGEKAVETTLDLSEVNGGVVISLGEETYANFTFSQDKPFPISDEYRIDAYVNDDKIGSYPFSIVAADGSAQGDTNLATATEPAGASNGQTYGINKPAEVGDLIVTVTGVEMLKGDEFSTPEAGNMFIAVDVDIKNTGNEKQIVSSLLQMSARDGAGHNYGLDLLASTLAGDGPDGDIEPGASLGGKVGFQVPEDVSGLQFIFDDLLEGTATFDLQAPTTNSTEQTTTTAYGPLKQYIHPSGIFSIDLPSNWENTNNEQPGIVQFGAYPSDSAAGIVMIVSQSKEQLGEKQQVARLQEVLQAAYGDQPDFTLGDVEKQPDSSQLVGINYTDNGTAIHGDSYVWQSGNKLIILYAFANANEYDELWTAGLSDIVNSVQIDDNASFTL